MKRAVGELDTSGKYKGKLTFSVVPFGLKESQEVIKREDLGTHGLVGFGRDRTVKVKLAGHNYGKEEIVEQIDDLLKQEAKAG